MATATAPVKTAANKQKRSFTQQREFIFRLTKKHPEYYKGSSPYAVSFSLPNADMIYWPQYGSGEKEGEWLAWEDEIPEEVYYSPRGIRYIFGAPSIFVDEQEKNADTYKRDLNGKNPLLDSDNNKRNITFSHAEIRVPANDKTRLQYLWANNQCKNQFEKANERGKRYKQVNAQYEVVINSDADARQLVIGKAREKATELARTARTDEMLPHAKWLNIPFTYQGTDERRSDEAIRESYIEKAFLEPVMFMDSFSNPQITLMYQIRNLMEQNEITLLKTPGQAHWVSTGGLITVLPPDKTPVEALADYAMTKDGEQFANELRSYKK